MVQHSLRQDSFPFLCFCCLLCHLALVLFLVIWSCFVVVAPLVGPVAVGLHTMMVFQRKRTMPSTLHIGRNTPHGSCSFCCMCCKTMAMYPSGLPVQVVDEPCDEIAAALQLCAAFWREGCVCKRCVVVVSLVVWTVSVDGATVGSLVAPLSRGMFTARKETRITAKMTKMKSC